MSESASRCVLITGVGRGIGRATARLFREEGWRTIGIDVESGDLELGAEVDRFERADVADAAEVSRIVATIAAQEGRLDALVNNAAVQVCKPLRDTTLAEWDRVLSVNLRGPFWLMHEALPLLEKSKGAIVNVSSVHAVATSTNICAYATSKGALAAMTRAAALELAPKGVRVNAVLPGAVDTPMLRAGFARSHVEDGTPEEQLEAFAATHPLGRVAEPAEIARAILYLADNASSSYVTGQSHVVDGGVTVRLSTE